MKLRIVRRMKEMLDDAEARDTFMTIVALRQRLFEAEHRQILCMDRYDLIADHVVLYADDRFEHPMAYVRSVSSWSCREFGIESPVWSALSGSTLHREAFQEFTDRVPNSVTMGYLCLDQAYRKEVARGTRIIDLMVWAAFQAARPLPAGLGYAATPNAKFRQNYWLRQIGAFNEDLPQFVHPAVPQPHDLVMIPRIRDEYWGERQEKYGSLLSTAHVLAPSSTPSIAV